MGKKIVVLGTGGTMSGVASTQGDNVGYQAGERSIASLLIGLATDAALNSEHWVADQVAQIDSKDADFDLWTALYRTCLTHLGNDDVAGIVITHGTDTLEETAWLLDCVLPVGKPVVLTCAMRPATALAPDGPQNLLDALALAQRTSAFGVSVVCAGTVHAPKHVRKVHPYRTDALSSGDAGPIGWIEEGALRLARSWSQPGQAQSSKTFRPPPNVQSWPWVEIVQSHAGARSTAIDAIVAAGVQGIVVAATGNGTLHHVVESALRRALERGVAVRVTSKCPLGAIVGQPVHGLPLGEAGLSPEKVRISLMLELIPEET